MADFLLSHPAALRNNFTGAVGCRFTVSVGIVITRLGRFYDTVQPNTQNHQISLWISTDQVTPLAQATILAATASDANGYKFVTLATPVVLLPGNTYSIAIDENNAGDKWPDTYTPTKDNHFTIVQACFSNTGTAGVYPNNNGIAGQTNSTPNMQNVWDFFLTDALTMSDQLGIGRGNIHADQMTMSDSVQVAVPLSLSLSDSLNNWADSASVQAAIAKSFADSLNFWADGTTGGSIGFGARVSQVVVEAMAPGSPAARVTQVVVEVMVARAIKQPRISVST